MTEQLNPSALPAALTRLLGQLVVSVQADDGSPLREVAHIVAMSRAALLGGAAGLRLRSAEDIRAVRAITGVPIIGLTKQAHPGTDVYITATPQEVHEVAAAGADIVAFDGTDLPRPHSVAELVAAAHAAGGWPAVCGRGADQFAGTGRHRPSDRGAVRGGGQRDYPARPCDALVCRGSGNQMTRRMRGSGAFLRLPLDSHATLSAIST
jgi:hypothetical protein